MNDTTTKKTRRETDPMLDMILTMGEESPWNQAGLYMGRFLGASAVVAFCYAMFLALTN